jgi:hypothetical protein
MILEITQGAGPYLIAGEAHQHWFSGCNIDADRIRQVTARWTMIEDEWIGIWVEEGIRYLITFRLPRTTVPK